MNSSDPQWFMRVARRCFIGVALTSCIGVAAAADLSGFWMLDAQRSELRVDESLLSQRAHERVREFDPLKHDPVSVCMPYGMPRVMTALGAFPMEIVQTDTQVTMIFDPHDEVRRVFLGKQLDKDEELAPLWLGYAYGRWQGDALVIETVGVTDQGLIDADGVPHSDKLRIVERIKRVDANTLLNEMTLFDEDAFTRPVVRKLYSTRTDVAQPREFHCAETQWLDHVMKRAKELTREWAEKKP